MYEDRGPGYVILDRRPETVVPAISKSKPGIAIVVDEDKLVNHVLPIAKTTIFRRSDDDHAYERYDARIFVRELAARVPNVNVQLYLGNEPGRNNLPALARWTLDALDECDRLGRKGVALNFEVGVPEVLDWQRELSAVLDKIRLGGHTLGLHEYAGQVYYHPDGWHIGRWAAIPVAKRPRIFITEVGYAKDLDAHNGYEGDVPGPVAAKQLMSFHAYYSQHDIPSACFVLGEWHGFNVTPIADQLLPPTPVTIIPASGGSNLRSRPDVTSSKVTLVSSRTQGLQITPYPIPGADREDTHSWWPVRLSSGSAGWMRDDVVSFSATTGPVVKILSGAPYYSQSTSTATLPNDCGIAAARSMLGWFYIRGLGKDIPAISIDDVSKDVGLSGTQLTTTSHVLLALEKYGSKGLAQTMDLTSLRAELKAKRPVILLVNAGILGTSGSFKGPHWVTATGYASDDTIQILDPLSGEHWVASSLLDAAWAGAIQQGNPARRGITIILS